MLHDDSCFNNSECDTSSQCWYKFYRTNDFFYKILFPLFSFSYWMGGIASSGIMQPATVLLTGVTGVLKML